MVCIEILNENPVNLKEQIDLVTLDFDKHPNLKINSYGPSDSGKLINVLVEYSSNPKGE